MDKVIIDFEERIVSVLKNIKKIACIFFKFVILITFFNSIKMHPNILAKYEFHVLQKVLNYMPRCLESNQPPPPTNTLPGRCCWPIEGHHTPYQFRESTSNPLGTPLLDDIKCSSYSKFYCPCPSFLMDMISSEVDISVVVKV